MSFRVVVKKKREWFNLGILAFFTLFMAIGMYGTIRVECSRTGSGEPAHCSGRSTKLYSSHDVAPFPLERDAFRFGRTEPNSRNHRYPALVTPTGQLESPAALDEPSTRRVIAETNTFYENKEAREWQFAASTWKTSITILLVGSALIGLYLWSWRARALTILIDPRGGFIERDNEVWPIAKIESVRQRDSFRDGSEIELVVDGVPTKVCEGRDKDSATEATRALDRAIHGEAS